VIQGFRAQVTRIFAELFAKSNNSLCNLTTYVTPRHDNPARIALGSRHRSTERSRQYAATGDITFRRTPRAHISTHTLEYETLC
jgi:hypothetical protein